MVLSKEQRMALKEAKIKAQEEARKRAYMEFLRKEIGYQAKNKALLDQRWREMVIKIKLPKIKENVEIAWHVFDRNVDKKDHLMKYLLKLVDKANDQYGHAVSSFCETINAMIHKFLKNLETMNLNNKQRTKDFLKEQSDITNKIANDQDIAEEHLQLLSYIGESNADMSILYRRGEHLAFKADLETELDNTRLQIESHYENVYERMWSDYKNVLKAYVYGTVDLLKKVNKLRVRDAELHRIITIQARRLAESDDKLHNLAVLLQQYTFGEKQAKLRERYQLYRAAHKKMRMELLRDCAKDAQQIEFLVHESNAAMEWIESAAKKAEKIIKTANVCRKFETFNEKVLPFGTGVPDPPLVRTIPERYVRKADPFIINAISSTSGVTRLWQRSARAELSLRALRKEKKLLEENIRRLVLLKKADDERKTSAEEKTSSAICKCNDKYKMSFKKPVVIENYLALKHYDLKKLK